MLFSTEDLFEKKISGSIQKNSNSKFALCAPDETIKAKFGHIQANTTRYYVSGGVWALHDLVKYCLNEIGPASIIGFSWNLTTPAAGKLLYLKNAGLLREMSFIFDGGMSRWSRGALGMLKGNSKKVVTTMIHAKGFILWNENWKLSCISSANFSNNPRIESGYLSTEHEIFEFHRKWIERTLENGSSFTENPETEVEGIILPPQENTKKVVYIIRGIPGCGKSLLAESLAETVCENDEFFTNGNKYLFAPDAIQLAIAHCLNKFKEAIEDGIERIAVANVFPDSDSYQTYIKIARAHGYRVFVLINENIHNTVNIHGFSEEQIQKMKAKFKVTL